MADREPTVVERMAKAHWESTGGQWPDMRSDRKDMLSELMLAAVRELVVSAREADTPNGVTVADWLSGWVCDHQRRSAGRSE